VGCYPLFFSFLKFFVREEKEREREREEIPEENLHQSIDTMWVKFLDVTVFRDISMGSLSKIISPPVKQLPGA
jgi:hypothetical protein